MSLLAATGLIKAIGGSLDKLFTSDEERLKIEESLVKVDAELRKQKVELELAELSSEEKLALGQLAINQVDANSQSLLNRGWRPFIGWVCGLAFAYTYLLRPIVVGIGSTFGVDINMPEPDTGALMPVLLAILGVGGMRTFEKYKRMQQ